MKYDRPLKSILIKTRSHWDRDETRPAVRAVFKKALHCRTSELGAEVYSSENQYLVLYHTCKSRACPSCGYRATIQWLRERWAALPDVLYKGITFTMPDVLWPFFRDNPRLANALPALAAELIQARARAKHDVRVGVMAVVHTFNGKLEFNSHVHAMVTAGGLQVSSDSWIQSIYYDQDSLMEAWRKSVTALLRVAVAGGRIQSDLTSDQTKDLLDHLQNRWWSIKIQSFPNKGHFLKYAGRYVKRPPIAQRRISWIGERTVKFWYTDKKLDCRAYVQCSLEEFVDLGAAHSGAASPHCSEFWIVCSAGDSANQISHICSSQTKGKTSPQTSLVGGFNQTVLRPRSSSRRRGRQNEMGATAPAEENSLLFTVNRKRHGSRKQFHRSRKRPLCQKRKK